MPRRTNSPTNVANLGAKVPEDQLQRAVQLYLDQESTSAGVNKTEIGRELGFANAPEWLDGPLFIKKLEIARFTRETNRLRGVKEVIALLDRVMDAAMVEGYRRLIEEANLIPPSVLYGELLVKMVRLRQDLLGNDALRRPENVFISIQNDILKIENPKVRQQIHERLLADYDKVLQLKEANSDVAGGNMDVVDVEPISEPTSLPNPVPVGIGSGNQPNSPDKSETLWSDPALE